VVVQDGGGRLRAALTDQDAGAESAGHGEKTGRLQARVHVGPDQVGLLRLPAPAAATPRRQVERVPRLVPGARAEIVSGTGHGPQIDHAEEVNRRMLGFMACVD
jgi:pimeloyl-ACP methyl ester carboxylesterase